MNDEQRDPDLDWIRSHWKPPEPSATLAGRVRATYLTHFLMRQKKKWMWWIPVPVAAAAAAAFITLSKPADVEPYRAVAQPRIIVVSQGERP